MTQNDTIRIGVGYDIHRLASDRKLMLGGLEIPHDRGLLGHSDADVVLHSVTDALLGAASLPDIGDLFPDTDDAFKDADSRELLADVMGKISEKGYRVGNLDVIVHAETPKMSPYKKKMAESIAKALGVESDRVNVKAKTNEGVGPVGLSNAIACTTVALLMKD
jgi:2-C-methyl-D-erythritol 2,4-cyclodiphosphate synthase